MEKVHLVVYTDGSFKDNTIGYSLFGYIYKPENLGKKQSGLPKNINITEYGILNQEIIEQSKLDYGQERYKLYSNARQVIPEAYISKVDGMCGSNKHTPDIVVNSASAEAHTMLLLLSVMGNLKRNGKEVVDLLIKTDSQMLIYVLDSIKRGDGVSKYAFSTVYEPLNNTLREFINNGYNFNFQHIKGHVNNLGNEIVDRLANFAREANVKFFLSEKDEDKTKYMSEMSQYKYFPCNPKKDDFWTVDNIPEGFFGDKLFFLSEELTETRILYSFKYPKKKEPGEKDGTAITGIFIDKNKDDLITEIMKSELEYINNEKEYDTKLNTIGALNYIEMKDLNDPYANLFRKLGFTSINRYVNGDVYLQGLGKHIISRIVRPGILGVSLIESMEFYKTLLLDIYHSETFNDKELSTFKHYPGNVEVKTIDITDKFFEIKNNKNKLILPIIKDVTNFEFNIDVNGKPVKFTCVGGTDIPVRNYIKKMESLNNISMKLAVWSLSPTSHQYAYVMLGENKDGKIGSIWVNPYSCVVFNN